MKIAKNLFFDPKMSAIQRRKLTRWVQSMEEDVVEDFLLVILRPDTKGLMELISVKEARTRFLENEDVVLLAIVKNTSSFERFLCALIKSLVVNEKEIIQEEIIRLVEEIDYESASFWDIYHS